MSLGFPTNPTIGDEYTIGTTTYVWNGAAWIIKSQVVTATSLNSTGTVTITSTATSTSTTSGALIVTGGVGIGGDVYIAGTLNVEGQTILTTSSFNVDISEGNDIDIVVDSTNSNLIIISNISTLQTVTARGSTTTQAITITNNTESTSTTTGALIVTGGIGAGKRITCESLRIEDTIFESNEIVINNTVTTVIDSFSITEFRGAKYLIQIDEGTGPTADFEMLEIVLVGDNAGTVYATEYGLTTSGGELGTFYSDLLVDNIVRLYFQADFPTNKTITLLRIGMKS